MRRAAAIPALDVHFDREKTKEPVLVKNIENVQGDERDVIIFSVAVGPDETGRVTAQISSLNGEGGHRRLNVAVTRARRELVVFSTLRPQQIDLGRTSARGVADFKHFLEFAQRGTRAIAEAFAPTGGATESPFEDAVKRALEAKGWEVHPQIGVSYFRVDLGVVHPREPRGVSRRSRMRRRHLPSLRHRSRSRPPAGNAPHGPRVAHSPHLVHGVVDRRRRRAGENPSEFARGFCRRRGKAGSGDRRSSPPLKSQRRSRSKRLPIRS